ncbi:MAG: carboxymuconolactone decarboxylase family protein [Varibaculum sp.]|nr:carboxymuconolactone decarboxylase family protein [Varibaculum sp.]
MAENNRKVPYLEQALPEVYKAFGEVSALLKKTYVEVGLGADLIELVCLRASQLNRCPTCLSVHVPRALRAGVPQRKIDLLPAWRETNGEYTAQELAALALTETITLVPEGVTNGPAGAAALQLFNTQQLAALEFAIMNINLHNRISIFSQHPARKY